jgi:hypothetical protein
MEDRITLTLGSGAILAYSREDAAALTERLWGIAAYGGAALLAVQIAEALRCAPVFLATVVVSAREEAALRVVQRCSA